MAYYIYNAAPGLMYFLGNEIKAEAGEWTEVSEYSVNHKTFSSMIRMKFVYLVEADEKPTYDPTHPDNRAKAESMAPGAAAAKKEALRDGSMNEEELKKFLREKELTAVPDKVRISSLSEKTQPITAANLDDIGKPPVAFNPAPETPEVPDAIGGIPVEVLGETTPLVKEAAVKKTKVKKTETTEAPQNLGNWT